MGCNSLDGGGLVTKLENTDRKYRRYFANGFTLSLLLSTKTSNLSYLERAPGSLLYKCWSDICRTCRAADYAPAWYRMLRYLMEAADVQFSGYILCGYTVFILLN